MTPEAKFWNWMSDKFPSGSDIVRLENACSRGTPDVNICLPGGTEIWIELKVAQSNYNVLIRKEQRIFGIRRSKAGGRVFVIAQMPEEDTIRCWKYPIQTRTKNETYQLITDNMYFICHKSQFQSCLDWMLR